jgi:tRNA-Thr(GGU) m(6)t(6)A37 methyltransferase TsaA
MEQPDSLPIRLDPVGVVRNRSRDAVRGEGSSSWRERAARMKAQRVTVSEVVINAGLAEALDGIEDFSHIVVLYWAHRLPPQGRATVRVHPMGNRDFPEVGVFATQSPARPNPILTTVVRLLGREGNVLRVTGLDALDGSPVLDIKPYIPGPDELKGIRRPEWMRQINREFDPGTRED